MYSVFLLQIYYNLYDYLQTTAQNLGSVKISRVKRSALRVKKVALRALILRFRAKPTV